jgi:hypothetical protein
VGGGGDQGAETRTPTLTETRAQDILAYDGTAKTVCSTADRDPVTDTAKTTRRKPEQDTGDQDKSRSDTQKSMTLSHGTRSHYSGHACLCFLPSLRAGLRANGISTRNL